LLEGLPEFAPAASIHEGAVVEVELRNKRESAVWYVVVRLL
jgi:hypothetical protein